MKPDFSSLGCSLATLLAVILCCPTPVLAGGHKAPAAMHEFNVTCPAKEILPPLDLAYHRCNNGRQSSCHDFVSLLGKVLPEYDCQRSFDRNYVVPALWLADAAAEDYIRLLAQLKLPEAQQLFASEAFREVLDGDLAEEFGPLSRQAARQLAKQPSECPNSLTGNIAGVVMLASGPAADVEVRYRMSDDATILLRTASDGSFSISCVYPAANYQLCVGAKATEQCFSVPGPNAASVILKLLQ